MAGVGSEGALGSAGMAGAIRQMIVDRLTQAQAAQEMRQRNEQMVLAQRGADRADRALDQQDELKRLVMTQNADLKDQSALDTLVTQGAFSKGQELSPSTAARFQRHGLGDLAQEQQSLPSTQLQGGVRMPQILGRVIQPSGAMSPEQGDASSGAVTATPQSPMKTGRIVFAGTGKQADTTAERERKIQADKEKADNAAAFADVRERLATVAENRPTAAESTQLVPETDPKTGQQTGRYFAYNPKAKRFDLVAGPAPVGTHAPPGAAQNAQTDRTNKDAQDTLTQLDQAIENAKDLIGPGEGRVSNVEQMIGSADPRIQALGVKMKAAKMRVDHAITGSVRAGASPYLLQQWDNILANKITPEGLKAGVQAMREIVGGAPSGAQSDVIYARDPQGGLHQAKRGTPLPAGWKEEQR